MSNLIIVPPAPQWVEEPEYAPERLGRSWDDVQIGDLICDYPFNTVRITQELVDEFGGLTRDFNPIHTDPAFARKTVHRGPISHGLLMCSLAIGQYHRSTYTYGMTLALLNMHVEFLRATDIDDEVYFLVQVIAKEENPGPKRGIIGMWSQARSTRDHEPRVELTFQVVIERIQGGAIRSRLGLGTVQDSVVGSVNSIRTGRGADVDPETRDVLTETLADRLNLFP